MKKLLFLTIAIMLVSCPLFAINDWYQGTGTDPLQGTDNASDIDANTTNYAFDPLDRLLATYVNGCTLTRTSATVITVSAGEITCQNAGATIRRFRQNTSTTTFDMTVSGVGGLDSGSSEKNSTWYSLYAVADADATTFTVIGTEQGVAISDVTYYKYIGSVYNDSSGNLKAFFWHGEGNTITMLWDIGVSDITTVLSSGAWSGAISLSSAMPSTSTYALLGNYTQGGDSTAFFARPHGSTGMAGLEEYGQPWHYTQGGDVSIIGGMFWQTTDSSQRINHYEHAQTSAVSIGVAGFQFNR